jgi:hypothetical protein
VSNVTGMPNDMIAVMLAQRATKVSDVCCVAD